jgi:hypothetical protein
MKKKRCAMCNKKVGERYIKLPKGDLDMHGIWMGDLGKWGWFDDQVFCKFGCMVRWLRAVRQQIREVQREGG